MSNDFFAPPLPAGPPAESAGLCAVHTVVLDTEGLILAVSSVASRDRATQEKAAQDRTTQDKPTPGNVALAVGVNYLEKCRELAPGSEASEDVVQGIRRVLNGSLGCYTYAYLRPMRTEQRPFLMQVVPLALAAGAVLSHLDLWLLHTAYPPADPATRLQTALEEAQTQAQRLQTVNQELQTRAATDGLTGLNNHRAFQEQLLREYERARLSAHSLALVLLDIDHFKQHNDTFGHPAGDKILVQLADLLRSGARETDLLARYGGEEFALLLPNTGAARAITLAHRLRAAIAGASWPHTPVTASFGVAALLPAHTHAAALLEAADQALYAAKQAGRNCVRPESD